MGIIRHRCNTWGAQTAGVDWSVMGQCLVTATGRRTQDVPAIFYSDPVSYEVETEWAESFHCCVISQLSVGPNLHFSLNNIWSHISAFAKVLVDRLVVIGSPVTHLRKRSWQLSCWWKNDYYTYAFSVYSYSAVFGELVSPVCLDLHEASYMETLLKSDKDLLSLLQTGATLRRMPCFWSFCLPGDKPSCGQDKASTLGFSYLSPLALT